MKIGLDLDGVLYAFQATFIHMLERRFKDVRFPEGLGWWDTWTAADAYVNEGHKAWIWSKGVREGLFRQGHLLKGAYDGVLDLYEETEATIELITHRPARAMRDTIAWLDLHFGGCDPYPFSGIHLLTNEEPKSSVPGVDAYIDDGPHIAEDILENTDAIMLLWDRPYNQDVMPHDRLVRVGSWEEAIKEVGNL